MAKGNCANHTACKRGKRVLIKPIVGKPFVDVFIERKSGRIFLKNYGVITKKEIRSFSIYKFKE